MGRRVYLYISRTRLSIRNVYTGCFNKFWMNDFSENPENRIWNTIFLTQKKIVKLKGDLQLSQIFPPLVRFEYILLKVLFRTLCKSMEYKSE